MCGRHGVEGGEQGIGDRHRRPAFVDGPPAPGRIKFDAPGPAPSSAFLLVFQRELSHLGGAEERLQMPRGDKCLLAADLVGGMVL